jgi:tRNA A37 threonylcarbamoyladenosine dehydratase
MKEQFERTSLLIGEEAINKLNNSKVLIFGVGGVGGYVAEALARTGVGSITIVDKDTVSESNINRQIIALHSTVGRDKVDVLKERMLDINPNLQVDARKCFFLPENAHEFDFSQYDYIVDAVDTVTAKLQIIVQAKEAGVPVISAMGAGNKVHPEMFEIADIYKTEMCPLAKVMRRELKNRGIKKLKVVYSKEKPVYKGDVPGSIAFSPSVVGLLMASEVVRELCEVK